jgi:acetate CoA-transferase
MLVEIAPGIDLKKNIIEQMDFKPLISSELKFMDEEIFID